MNKCILEKVTYMILICLYFFMGVDTAIADSAADSTPTMIDNSNTISQDAIPIQQNTVQVNDFNALHSFSTPPTPPACSRKLCGFIMHRNTPYGSENNTGIVIQLGNSPEDTQAQAQKLVAITEKEKLEQEFTVVLMEKLADAIENMKMERARLYAISLAKKLGYADYRQLLKEISTTTGTI